MLIYSLFSEGRGFLKPICVGEGIEILGRFHGSQIKAISLTHAVIALMLGFASMTNEFESSM